MLCSRARCFAPIVSCFMQAWVILRVDNLIKRINLYSMDSAVHFVNTSWLGSDLPT